MTTENFDDALLTDVLDGIADERTVASVNADPAARSRLEALRAVSEMVATPPPPASGDRRAASIAAALAAAETPAAVTSLAPVRRARFARFDRFERMPTRWLAAAAAAAVVLIAIPIVGSLTSDDDVSIASDAATAEIAPDARSLGDRPDTDDAGDGGSDEMATAAVEESADAGDFDGDSDAAAEADMATAGDDSADSADDGAAPTSTVAVERSIPEVIDLPQLQSLIEDGSIGPSFAIDDPFVQSNIAGDCLAPFSETATESFALARLTPADGPARIVFVVFDDSGDNTAFDGEDCSPVG